MAFFMNCNSDTFDPFQMEYEKHLVGFSQWSQQLQENTWEEVQATHLSQEKKNPIFVFKELLLSKAE